MYLTYVYIYKKKRNIHNIHIQIHGTQLTLVWREKGLVLESCFVLKQRTNELHTKNFRLVFLTMYIIYYICHQYLYTL